MNSKKTWKPSLPILLLDVIGTILLGLGLAEYFAGVNLVPASLQFQSYDLGMIIVGVIFMLPMLLSVIQHARESARE